MLVKAYDDCPLEHGVYCFDHTYAVEMRSMQDTFKGMFVPSLSLHGKYEFCDTVTRYDMLPSSMDVCVVKCFKSVPFFFCLADTAFVYRDGIGLCRVAVYDIKHSDAFVSCLPPSEEEDAAGVESRVVTLECGSKFYAIRPESWDIERRQHVTLCTLSGTLGTVVNECGFFVPS